MGDAPNYGPDGSMQLIDELREMLTILQRGARGLDAWGAPDPALRPDPGNPGAADAAKRAYAKQYTDTLERLKRLESDIEERDRRYALDVARTEAELRLRAEEIRTQQMAIVAKTVAALAEHDPHRAFALLEERLPELVMPAQIESERTLVKLLEG